MRERLLFLLLLAMPGSLCAQHNLSGSLRTGYYTYIYRISPSETVALFRSSMNVVSEKHLHTLVDSFSVNQDVPRQLTEGNYLFVNAADNQLHYNLKIFGDVQYKLINNNRDLVVALHTAHGQLINDATVFINNRRVYFDPATSTYRVNKRRKSGLLKVNYHGVMHLFSLAKNRQAYYGRSSFFSRFSNSFPVKYITRPLKRLFRHNNYNYSNFYNSTKYEKKFTGYMVFSKPKYKPGDTVKLKAFILNTNGKPVNRPLLVRLSTQQMDEDTILTTLRPFRPGAYEYEFIITDSLDLSLDDRQLITFEELKSKKYNLDDYEGDLDDDEYLAKRQVLMRGNFYYEEYQLGTMRFTARTDRNLHHRGYPLAVYLKATNENDMAVLDGRVQILVTANSGGAGSFYAPKVFLPDTLWTCSQQLEPLGETKIILPDSIFPAASFAYEIKCILLNENNEYESVVLSQSFQDSPYEIRFTPFEDSIKIEQLAGARSCTANGILYAITEKDDTVQQQNLQLPSSIHINPFVSHYNIKTDSAAGEFELKQVKGMVSCLAARTSDSINVQSVNPKHIAFWYTLFAGNKVIHRGYGDSLSYRKKIRTAKNYFISLQYIYGNRLHTEDYTIPIQNKLLNISVSQPEYIYPGQQLSIEIAVTNAAGKPVKDADLSAWSFTDKFKNQPAPFVPYLGKIYPPRKKFRNFNGEEQEDISGSSKLNWERWSREMGLDSIEYFKFLHPGSIYTNTEPANDSITQLAPFVVTDGDIKPVHQIYIDEVPYFFSQARQLQRYSFKVSPGKHALRLRTNNQLITLDSVWAYKGAKTFISINAGLENSDLVKKTSMPDSLSNYEKALWSKYMILVQNNFGEAPATITQPDLMYLLNLKDNKIVGYPASILTGPFPGRYSTLSVAKKFSQPFETEGNYLFSITQGLIKQKQLSIGNYAFSPFLSAAKPAINFHDLVLTQKEVDSLWQLYLDNRSSSENLFTNAMLIKTGNGRLRIGVDKDANGDPVFIKNIFLFRNDDADFVRVYSGSSQDLGYIQPGMYRIFLLLKGNEYFIKDDVEVKKDGVNFYRVNINTVIKKDNVSNRIAAIIGSREKNWRSVYQENDLDIIKESFNEKYLDVAVFSRCISGSVYEIKSGLPVAGASVSIKGTKFATATDLQGLFTLKVPEKGTIVIASVGFESVEKRITAESHYDIKIRERSSALSEVVVVGYGTQLKRSMTASVSAVSADNILQGKVAGVQISIRGTASVEGNGPLIIVDGLPWSGKLDSANIAAVQVLTSSEAIALYGSSAANGVVIITTKKARPDNLRTAEDNETGMGNQLRNNFRDAAYWQPRLRTDMHGKASFTVTFPDDITRWRTFVIAMAAQRQTGFTEGYIKSFKSLSANISMPSFAVEGDSIHMIGKVLNYGIDSIYTHRSIFLNDSLLHKNSFGLLNSHIDTIDVTVNHRDSLKLKYVIQKVDGYFEGEERAIPIFKEGTQETKGFFCSLEADTSFTLLFDTLAGKIKIYAETSALPVLLDEIEKIGRYEYLCNEQLASKLVALLLKKDAYGFLKKEFKEEKNISAIITKLNQGKAQAGLWGWWNNNDTELWISLHVTEAMHMARKAGYQVNINKEIARDYLIYNFGAYAITDKIYALRLLKLLDAKADFKKYTDSLESRIPLMSMYQQLQFLQLKQQLGMPVVLDTLLQQVKTTMFGNFYWGEENKLFFDNAIENTLLVYRLMRNNGGYEKQLKKISNYFFEKRKDGQWRNTYESALILETILPDIIKKDTMPEQATLIVNGMAPVHDFPYAAESGNTGKMLIKKQGNWPVYFTAYQQYWNPSPIKVSGDFIVSSFFEKNGAPIAILKAGEPVIMNVVVDVKGDAGYIMVEIPIPAGCSYKDKHQYFFNNEVHREYFKNKVSIFCSSLRKGKYVFTVSLLPAYSGSYQLNPAKAAMMYFPVFYGQEAIKKIKIE